MKYYINQAVSLFILSTLTLFAFSKSVFATTYGSGSYDTGLFNEGEIQQTSVTSMDNNSVSSLSNSVSPSCGDQKPGDKNPWLYAATAQSGTAILLYFTPADDPVSYYAVEFGTESGKYIWGLTDIGSGGSRTYLVNSLQPNTTYFFKVRAGNGCAPGEWSNELSAKTKSAVSFKQFETKNISLVSIADSKKNSEESIEAISDSTKNSAVIETDNEGYYIVRIKVIDEHEQPVEGAKVTIYSKVSEALTDDNGLVIFNNIDPGEHRVLIAYDNYEGEQSLQLNGEVQQFDLTITIKKRNILVSPIVLIIIAGLIFTSFILFFLLFKRTK
ncbi:MAG: carboxypeptidase regulatory-like domain-containing protein [Pseudomonadales bacterium]|nr:carboxypeptidase regulatory-like domain-containing protein [Pseudomonadales bacterium]